MKKIALLILCAALLLSAVACGAGASTWQEQYDLGVRYLSDGNYEEAIIAFTAAIEIEPMKADAYLGRAEAYIGCGETEENLAAARADYEKVIELDASRTEGYLGLADVYIRQEEYEKAQEILEKGLEKTGNDQAIADKLEGITEVSLAGFIGKPLGELADYLGMEYTTVGRVDEVIMQTDMYAAVFQNAEMIVYCEDSRLKLLPTDSSIITTIECGDLAWTVLDDLKCDMTYNELVEAVGDRAVVEEPVFDGAENSDAGTLLYWSAFEMDGYRIGYAWSNDPYSEDPKEVMILKKGLFDEIAATTDEKEWIIKCYKGVLSSGYTDAGTYTLYDIDKNGVPELIVNLDFDNDVYRIEDGFAVFCDNVPAYDLYEYDGNGMLVHHGGMGYMHFEFVSLYKMAYADYPLEDTVISTEEYSYAEIQEYLEQYTKIETFSPVTDYTLLESMTLSAA